MYKTINETPEQKVLFTSDPHLGHQRDFVWEARGCTSADHHTAMVIDSYNAVARPNDILMVLGDFCLNTDHRQFDAYLDRIVCQNIHMIMGNHPNPHYKTVYKPMVKQILGEAFTPDSEIYPLRYKNLVYINHQVEMVVNRQMIFLSHYPLLSWNQMGHGAWALVGHEHGGLEATRPECKHGKILDVGWDMYKKPLTFDEVKVIMDTKSIIGAGHHASTV